MERSGEDEATARRHAGRSALVTNPAPVTDGADLGLDEQEVLSRAVGSWQDRAVDSVEYVDRLRSGHRLDDVR